jgi:hypothetical protein
VAGWCVGVPGKRWVPRARVGLPAGGQESVTIVSFFLFLVSSDPDQVFDARAFLEVKRSHSQ